MNSNHPWAILPLLVEAEIISKEDARSLVMGHQDMHRRIVQEILFSLSDLVEKEEMTPEGVRRIHAICQRYQMLDTPDMQ
jgi:hypothetical protein